MIKDGTVEVKVASEDSKFGTADSEVQNQIKFDWDTEDSDPVIFNDDWTDVPTSTSGYPTTYKPAGEVDEDELDENGHWVVPAAGEKAMLVVANPTDEQAIFTTWLMIPQEIKGKTVTITYLINDRQFKAIFPLSIETDLEDWVENQYIKYNVTLSPNKITFTADVTDWDKYNVNLDEEDPTLTPEEEENGDDNGDDNGEEA